MIGCGPAGATAAAVLAAKGRRVRVLEKERFPRYHIGESLLPYAYFPLQKIGVLKKIKTSGFTKKLSVQFVSRNGRLSQPFYFFRHLNHEAAETWQVLRSEFDQLLMENAREKGAEVTEQVAVRELIEENGYVIGVDTVDKSGCSRKVFAPITVDATGRDAFSMTRKRWKVRDPYLNKVAIWTYYKGAMRDSGIDQGATTIAYTPEKGWFWYIPLAGDITSVGIVAEKEYLYRGFDSNDNAVLQNIFQRQVRTNAWVERHLAEGQQFGPYRVTGEYSYRSHCCAANGLVLVGDAFAFLDPVFSSGVFLALCGGERAAEAVDQALNFGDYSAARFAAYGAEMCRGIEAMRRLVYAFYDQSFSFRVFLDKHPSLAGPLTDVLIGNVFTKLDPLWEAVGDFAKLPPALTYGSPFLAPAVH